MKHLIPMTDFVLEQDEKESLGGTYDRIVRYAKFLKRPLKLGMFIPCDGDGNILEKPINPNQIEPQPMLGQIEYNHIVSEWEEYQQAKERVLFETIFIADGGSYSFRKRDGYQTVEYNPNTNRFYFGLKTIEDSIKYDLTLTQSALKQLGL